MHFYDRLIAALLLSAFLQCRTPTSSSVSSHCSRFQSPFSIVCHEFARLSCTLWALFLTALVYASHTVTAILFSLFSSSLVTSSLILDQSTSVSVLRSIILPVYSAVLSGIIETRHYRCLRQIVNENFVGNLHAPYLFRFILISCRQFCFVLYRQDSRTPRFPSYYLYYPFCSLIPTFSITSLVLFLQTCIRNRDINDISQLSNQTIWFRSYCCLASKEMLICSCSYYYQHSQSTSQIWPVSPHSQRINNIFSN